MRAALALLRILLLYIALWAIGTVALLQVRADRQAGVGTLSARQAENLPLDALPFSGINVSLLQSDVRADRLAHLLTLQEDGFGWVRQRIDWAQVEPQPGEYNWDAVDALIDDIRTAGLVPVIVLDGAPAWARAAMDNEPEGNAFAPPADPAGFAGFAAAFSARYADAVRFYQVWDEPNIAPHWGARWVNPVEYATMLRLASEAIRHADPDAVILAAALAPTTDRGHLAMDEVYFLQRMIAAGAAPYFDAVAIQPFGFGHTPEDPTQQAEVLNFRRAEFVRRALVSAGLGDKPLLAARYGWNRSPHSPWGAVSKTNQRRFAVDALDIAYHDWPWLAGMAWALDRPEIPLEQPFSGFALTEGLSADLATWHAERPARTAAPLPSPSRGWLRWAMLAIALVLAVWRVRAALLIPPWHRWRGAYLRLQPYARVAIWAALLAAYWFTAWPPLVVACWAVAACLILAQPAHGLWLAAAVVPYHFQHKEIYWGELSLAFAPATAAALCLLPALAVHHRHVRPRPDRWDGLAISWILVVVLSALGVWYWPAHLRGWIEFVITPLVLYLAVRALTHKGHDRRAVLIAMTVGGTFVAVFGLVGWLYGGGTAADATRRLVGPYFAANHAALSLERTLFVALGLTFYYSAARRWALAVADILVVAALILTASRGALFLAVPAGLLVLLLHSMMRATSRAEAERSRGRAALMIAMIMLVAVCGAALVLPIERLTNSATIAERWALWQSAARLGLDHWLTGVGPNGFYWTFPAYIPVQSPLDPNLLHPHNIGLEYASTGGIWGLVWLFAAAMMLTQGVVAARSSGIPAWPGYGLFAALAAAFAHGQVDAFAALPDLAAWNWLAFGLLASGLSHSRPTR